MGLNQKIEFSYLHQQLLSDNLTQKEKEELWVKIQSTYKNEELELLMHEYWQSLGEKEIISNELQLEVLKNQILYRIQKSKNESNKTYTIFPFNGLKILTRVAAILFVPLLLVSIYMFYRMDNRYNNIASTSSVMQEVIACPGSRVHFTLPDHSEVWLNSGSKLEFSLNMVQMDRRNVKLTGQGYFKVAHDKKHPFIVETDKMKVKALGTSFDVSSYDNDSQISSILEEGSIALISLQDNEFARLTPGQQAVLNKLSNELIIRDVDTTLSTSWRNGKLVFRNTSLVEVTKQMERWFNCQIKVDPKLLNSNILYTATIQDETLGEVLKMIEISTSVKTKIEKREVSIWSK
jgi:ferric-dicitrate binding protein FerR (iron transport regulator)